jgi:hypothetical protein
MNQIMTFEQMREAFDSEWLLIADPQVDESMNVVAGHVVFHSKDRDEVYDRAIHLKLKRSATLYTGKIQQGTAVVL